MKHSDPEIHSVSAHFTARQMYIISKKMLYDQPLLSYIWWPSKENTVPRLTRTSTGETCKLCAESPASIPTKEGHSPNNLVTMQPSEQLSHVKQHFLFVSDSTNMLLDWFWSEKL